MKIDRKEAFVIVVLWACVFIGFGVMQSGCVSIPRQTVELNAILGTQIDESEKMAGVLIAAWEKESRARAETFLHYQWIRQYILNFLEYPNVKSDLNKIVCGDNGKMDRAIVIQNVVEAISENIEAKRRELFGAIESERAEMQGRADDHFAEMRRMHSTIQANIFSVSKGNEFEKEIRAALARPIKAVIPIDHAREKLDALMQPLKGIKEAAQ